MRRPSAKRLPASRSVRLGLGLFVLGLVFIAVDVLPYFDGEHDTPLWLNLACLLAPLGFLIAIWSAVRAGRAQQRAALADLSRRAPIH